MRNETVRGLLPRSWFGVALWAVIVVVAVSSPARFFGFVTGSVVAAGQWVDYQMFAECGAPPPHDWMDPKPCGPNAVSSVVAPTPPELPDEHCPPPTPASGGSYRVDLDGLLTDGLDAGTDAVRSLSGEVAEVRDADSVVIDFGGGE